MRAAKEGFHWSIAPFHLNSPAGCGVDSPDLAFRLMFERAVHSCLDAAREDSRARRGLAVTCREGPKEVCGFVVVLHLCMHKWPKWHCGGHHMRRPAVHR